MSHSRSFPFRTQYATYTSCRAHISVLNALRAHIAPTSQMTTELCYITLSWALADSETWQAARLFHHEGHEVREGKRGGL